MPYCPSLRKTTIGRNFLRQSVTHSIEGPKRSSKGDLLPPSMECTPRFWYDAWQDLNAGVPIDTWRQRRDLQRGHGSGHYLAPAGPADLVSGLEAPICFGGRLSRRPQNRTD